MAPHMIRAVGETFERRFDYAQARPNYQKALEVRLAMGPEAGLRNRQQIALLSGGVGQIGGAKRAQGYRQEQKCTRGGGHNDHCGMRCTIKR